MNLNITGTSIKESFHRINITVLLDNDPLEIDGRYFQLSCHLWIHDVLTPGHAFVWSAVDHLCMELLLLRKRNFLSMKTFQIRHLTLQLGKFNQSINLISQQDRFLFCDMFLVGRNLDEEVATRNAGTSLSHMRLIIIISSMHLGRTIRITGSLSGNINLNSAGCQFLSPYKDLGRTDGENTILRCI